MSKRDSLRFRLGAVDALAALKQAYSYRDLAKLLGLPETVLNRYVRGRVIPSFRRADALLGAAEQHIRELVRARVTIRPEGVVDHSAVVCDVQLEYLVAQLVYQRFKNMRVDRVFTAETDGLPLAVQVANEFGVGIVIAKRSKEPGTDRFLEARVLPLPSPVPYLYVPEGVIRASHNILIVDDLLRSGATVAALVNLTLKARANLIGVYAILAVRDAVDRLAQRLKALEVSCPVEALLTLAAPRVGALRF